MSRFGNCHTQRCFLHESFPAGIAVMDWVVMRPSEGLTSDAATVAAALAWANSRRDRFRLGWFSFFMSR